MVQMAIFRLQNYLIQFHAKSECQKNCKVKNLTLQKLISRKILTLMLHLTVTVVDTKSASGFHY